MISVENLYWSLHKHLLQPVGLDAWYFFPFGTTQNLSRDEFAPMREPCDEHHVLFQFDQEPLWDIHRVYADHLEPARQIWSNKMCRLLANSEHSRIKKQVCHTHNMLDWYYFFHGLVALDWFRDARYFGECHPVMDAYQSLNHLITHKRSYRLALLARLIEHDIIAQGSISLHATMQDCESVVKDTTCQLSSRDRSLIARHLVRASNLPWTLDSGNPGGDLSAHFGNQEYRLWQRSLVHVVNETVFYDPKLHLTEKVFKPIVAMRAFVLVAAPGNLRYLRSYGFQTFGDWIDESYDDEPDNDRRLDMIANEIAKISALTLTDLRKMHRDMMPVLEHNKRHFYQQFPRLIIDEMVDNFLGCLRIWNNGRIDDRDLKVPADLGVAKQYLCQGLF